MGAIKMTLHLEGEDQQQMDAISANFINAARAAAEATGEPLDAEFVRATDTSLTIKRLLSNLPVQMSHEDARQLQILLHQMMETSPGPATLALEILDAAILLNR